MELTTPLAMPDSLPATERTPSFSCDMSGALGSTLVKRYELVAACFLGSSNRSAELMDVLPEKRSSRALVSYSEVSCFPKYMSEEMAFMSPNFFCASPLSDSGAASAFLRDAGRSSREEPVVR